MIRKSLPAGVFVLAAMMLLAPPSHAQFGKLFRRAPSTNGFHGQVLDFTYNHGADRRLYSEALCEKRDLYIYLPPCYDPAKKYPFIFWLHGIEQDEKGFLQDGLPQVDRAMASGALPPAIIAIPDGSLRGRPGYFSANSAFLNTRAGNFEDHLFNDVREFVRGNFSIRSERQAHVLAGVSIGGGA